MTQRIDLALSPELQHYLEGIIIWERLSATTPRMLGESEEEAWKRDPDAMATYYYRMQEAWAKHATKDQGCIVNLSEQLT